MPAWSQSAASQELPSPLARCRSCGGADWTSRRRANVGTIKGGSVRNAVPADAQLEGEVRSLVPERAMTVANAIRETFESLAADAGARVEIEMGESTRAMSSMCSP